LISCRVKSGAMLPSGSCAKEPVKPEINTISARVNHFMASGFYLSKLKLILITGNLIFHGQYSVLYLE
jgi:hypothetical protein